MSRAKSNANKENVNQGNKEVTEEEEDPVDGLLDEKQFNNKYTKLQAQWMNGHRRESDLTEEEKAAFGDHAYILKYCLGDGLGADSQQIVFHPKTSYSYTDYEKQAILPLMDEDKLRSTQRRFQSHIDRLEKKILCQIKEREAAMAEEKERAKEEEDRKEREEGSAERKKEKKRRKE